MSQLKTALAQLVECRHASAHEQPHSVSERLADLAAFTDRLQAASACAQREREPLGRDLLDMLAPLLDQGALTFWNTFLGASALSVLTLRSNKPQQYTPRVSTPPARQPRSAQALRAPAVWAVLQFKHIQLLHAAGCVGLCSAAVPLAGS